MWQPQCQNLLKGCYCTPSGTAVQGPPDGLVLSHNRWVHWGSADLGWLQHVNEAVEHASRVTANFDYIHGMPHPHSVDSTWCGVIGRHQ